MKAMWRFFGFAVAIGALGMVAFGVWDGERDEKAEVVLAYSIICADGITVTPEEREDPLERRRQEVVGFFRQASAGLTEGSAELRFVARSRLAKLTVRHPERSGAEAAALAIAEAMVAAQREASVELPERRWLGSGQCARRRMRLSARSGGRAFWLRRRVWGSRWRGIRVWRLSAAHRRTMARGMRGRLGGSGRG